MSKSDFCRVWRIILILSAFCLSGTIIRAAVNEPLRKEVNINEGWFFYPDDLPEAAQTGIDVSRWQKVNLPHTWNTADVFDDTPGYRTGVGWYRKEFNLSADLRGKKIFLSFESVGQKAEVFVNGKLAGSHQGGYTAFKIEITDYLQIDRSKPQIIAVKSDNTPDPNLAPPTSADFNQYGGIYRDVSLIAVEPLHFSLNDHGSSGIYIDTPDVSEKNAVVRIRNTITSHLSAAVQIRSVSTIFDANGRFVTQFEATASAAAQKNSLIEQKVTIADPNLWSPESPYLYRIKNELYRDGRLIDEICVFYGIRWFSFDPDQGFFLNGKSYQLHGANRHQDYPETGNAVSNELQEKDLKIIKETGFNLVLLPHYPQDPTVLDAADRLGLLVWAELPLVREISTSPKYADNAREMFLELIRQQYNHPSIIIWCYMNEIFLRPLNEPGYVVKTVQLARELETIARAEDPYRYTAISANRPYDGSDIYNASGLMKIPKIVAWHMYFGWYYGDFKDFGVFLDTQHRRFPGQNIFVSEYGADYDTRLNSLNPMIGDGTAEWARALHESYVEQIEARSFLAGSGVWSQFEFGSEARGDSRPHLNTKGIYTFDRRPKDIVFLYKAKFSKQPVLYISTRDWADRRSSANSMNQADSAIISPITVYSNLAQVELFINGRSFGEKKVEKSGKAVWEVLLPDGLNEIEARGKSGDRDFSDRTQIRMIIRPALLTTQFLEKYGLLINVGAAAQFTDAAGNIWEPDQPYQKKGWGFIGGKAGRTSQNIQNTPDDPLYQTFRLGLTAYRFDIPDGKYEVELKLAEANIDKNGERVFTITANGSKLLKELDLAKEYGLLNAVSKTFQVQIKGGRGLSLDFAAVSGETVLSAIRLRRLPSK